MKKKNILTIILVILAAASVAFSIYMKHKLEQQKADPTGTIGKTSTMESSVDEIVFELRHEKPIIKTDFDGIFYSFDNSGIVTFYKYDGAELKPYTDVQTLDFSVSMSDDEIKAKLYYFSQGEKYCGYAVFNSGLDSSVKVYTFVLFKLVTLSNGDNVLLVSSEPSTAYNNYRVWDDMFEIDLESGKTSRYFSERNRGVDMSGARRRDFFVTTDDTVKDFGDDIVFFSARDYQTDETNGMLDVYIKSGNKENKVAEQSVGCFAAPATDGIIYIKPTRTGFSLVQHDNDEDLGDIILLTLEGDYSTAYARSGNYLLDKENGVVYSLIDGTKRELKDYSISAMTFSISPDGNCVLLTGTVTNALEYGVYTFNFTTGESKLYIKEEFATLFNPAFVNNNEFIYTYSDGEIYKTVITKV
jgi:hypothetical protein